MEAPHGQADALTRNPTWALVVPTLERIGVLRLCIECAVAQSVPPSEIIVVDASAAWEDHRKQIEPIVLGSNSKLIYLEADERSSAVQRNQGIAAASTDIVFMIDDDSLMYPDCASEILEVYAADSDRVIVAASATAIAKSPVKIADSGSTERKVKVRALEKENAGRFTFVYRWITREVLMADIRRMFVCYDDPDQRFTAKAFPEVFKDGVRQIEFLPGYAMTARRHEAAQTLFEPALLSYSPLEDLDFSYRLGRLGYIVVVASAKLHHYEAKSGRTSRMRATALQIGNMSYMIKKNANASVKVVTRFTVWTLRHIVGHFLKDLASGRFSFPQAIGALIGMRAAIRVLRHSNDKDLSAFYRRQQQKILSI